MKHHGKFGKILLTAVLAVLAAAVLSGCGSGDSDAEDNLVVFNYGDYIDMDTLYMF